jgi:hypothetical protein
VRIIRTKCRGRQIQTEASLIHWRKLTNVTPFCSHRSGGIDLGTTKILCLEAPTPDAIIREFDLMKDEIDAKTGRKKQRTFDGRINFSEHQWRKIRRVLMLSSPGGGAGSATGSQESSFGFEGGGDFGDHKNVIFVVQFPLLYDPSKSELEDR